MNSKEVLAMLKKAGKPQTAAIYKHHDSGNNVFGTLTSDIAKIAKKIKVDDALAATLWKTGNAEARVLALQVTDPAKLTRADADRLIEEGQRFVGYYLAELVARSPVAQSTMRAWMKSKEEFRREMGYSILGFILKENADAIVGADAEKVLATIEKDIHGSPNWARYAMNGAVISIGVFKPALRDKALAAAQRIGHVDVDHGETHCKTPEAVSYIKKALKRKY